MTTIDNPASPKVQAIVLKGHLKLHAKGLRARGVTPTRLLKLAGNITGKTYKRGQYEQAVADLEAFINEGV